MLFKKADAKVHHHAEKPNPARIIGYCPKFSGKKSAFGQFGYFCPLFDGGKPADFCT